jgi:hypothetical protein
MTIELVIDELVLDGFDATARHAIGDAVAGELTRLARAHGAELSERASMDVPSLEAGAFRAPFDSPAKAGAGIAASVFMALKGHVS